MEDIALEGEIEDMEWSLDAHDGDIAALLQLVSEDQVAIRFSWPARADLVFEIFLDVDTSHPQSVRSRLDWNSKRAGMAFLSVQG